MLASHRHKFIYTKTNKSAGTSVEVFFEPFCVPEGTFEVQHGREESVTDAGIVGFRGGVPPEGCLYWNHMSARRVKVLIGDDIWNEYFKFTTIRNPFTKVISQYYFNKFLAEKMKQKGKGRYRLSFGDLATEREEFFTWIKSTVIDHDKNKYMMDGAFCLDDVIRFEKLTDDIQRICGILGVSGDVNQLPAFKKGIRPVEATPEAVYTKESRAFVANLYAYELDYFGYSFPGE